MDRDELRRIIDEAAKEAMENETLDRLSRIEKTLEEHSKKLEEILELLEIISASSLDKEKKVEDKPKEPLIFDKIDWDEILKNTKPLIDKLGDINKTYPIFDSREKCSDGNDHEYPGGWAAVIPPNCKKCGKPARNLQSWSSDPRAKQPDLGLDIRTISGLANDVAYLINKSAVAKLIFDGRTEG